MPKEFEAALRKQAEKKGLTGERADKFVFGTMRKAGWKPGQKEYADGGKVISSGPMKAGTKAKPC